MGIYQFEGKKPVIGKGTFVHPDATIIGNVTIGEGCYIGPGARIRGDWGAVVIGDYSNVQDNCIIHVFPGQDAILGPRSHIGHGAILHTPTLEEHVLVGMGAIIMDFCHVGEGCCIGAGALLTEKTVIPPYKLVLGSPAKVVSDLSKETRSFLELATEYYIGLPPRCIKSMSPVKLEECMVKDG